MNWTPSSENSEREHERRSEQERFLWERWKRLVEAHTEFDEAVKVAMADSAETSAFACVLVNKFVELAKSTSARVERVREIIVQPLAAKMLSNASEHSRWSGGDYC